MTLNFPNRLGWLLIGIAIFFLMQSGCKPIQPPVDAQPSRSTGEVARASLSTNISNETTSPNGEWTATTLFQVPRSNEEYHQSLVVTYASGSPSYVLVDGWFPMGLGYTVATPLMWSQDGNRFYYTNIAHPDGCGILINSTDLYQVDLTTGETTEMLAGNTTSNLALAPDEQHVAYFTIGEPSLFIYNLNSDETAPVDLASIVNGDQAGAIVWSPDNSAIAFVVAHNPCIGGWAEATSIYTLDVATMSLVSHLEQDERLLVPKAWTENETLMLQDDQGEHFMLDLATDTVTQ